MNPEDRTRLEEFRQFRKEVCVSKVEMTPLTAKLKCPL